MEFGGTETTYFRVPIGAGMKQSIQFAGAETFAYTAYISVDGAYQQVELTENAQDFAASGVSVLGSHTTRWRHRCYIPNHGN